RLAGDQYAQAQDVHEDAVHRGLGRHALAQVDAQQVDQQGGVGGRRQQGDAVFLAVVPEIVRRLGAGRQKDGRHAAGHQFVQVVLPAARVEPQVVGHFLGAEYLDAPRVDQVQVADQVGCGAAGVDRKSTRLNSSHV